MFNNVDKFKEAERICARPLSFIGIILTYIKSPTLTFKLEIFWRLYDGNKTVILRCPIIPGVNDTEAHFAALRELKASHACIQRAEVMAYHDIGKGKWQALGQPYALAELKTVPPDQKRRWQQLVDGESK